MSCASLRVLALFLAKPYGLTTNELAERLDVTSRTVQRDILHLQSDLHVPFVRIGTRWTVPSDYWLGPVTFNVHEAMATLLSARLMLRYADKAKPFASDQSQEVEDLVDGSVKVRLLVSEPKELKHWVLGWGSTCEVIRPAAFRAEVAAEAAAMAGRYQEAMRPAVVVEDERRAG